MPRWNQWTELHFSNITLPLKRRRVTLFLEALALGPADQVLDLGSEDGSYLASCYPWPHNIWLADIQSSEETMKRGVEQHKLKGYSVIPAKGMLPFANKQFDAVWRNSVIEHVTVDKQVHKHLPDSAFQKQAEAHQTAFAQEIARIGRKCFVQTPYKHFPIETHAWLPLIQYLPQPTRYRIAHVMRHVWIKQWSADFLLYTAGRFHRDFAYAPIVAFERVFCIRKSLLAYGTLE